MNSLFPRDFAQDENEEPSNEIVLVIDDELDWLSECEFMLRSLGYIPKCASTREESLQLIAEHEITTVVVDYNMPGCNGLALMQELSDLASQDGRSLHFILATGHATVELAVHALRAAATDFLEKPVGREQLGQALLRTHGVKLEGSGRTALVNRLATLSTELQQITKLISPSKDTPGQGAPRPAAKLADPSFIRRLLRDETRRRQIGNGVLFGDPAWSMLLDLLLARLEGRNVAVSSACIASGAPTTTALRLVNRLVAESILARVPDANDGRRDFLAIDPMIETSLMAYLSELAQIE